MTDARYVFQQDIRERSKMKTGALHKKNGSKSKKCSLPSDYLTNKEKKKMSGPVVSINMSQPYTDWIAFKKIPTHLQSEYINGLVDNYGARCCDLAEMFGIKNNTLNNYCNRFKPHPKFKVGARTPDNRWLDFITAPTKPEPIIRKSDDEILAKHFGITAKLEKPVKVELPESPAVIDIPKKEETPFMFEAMESMRFSANGSKAQIMQMLDMILGEELEYSISIDISQIYRPGIRELQVS